MNRTLDFDQLVAIAKGVVTKHEDSSHIASFPPNADITDWPSLLPSTFETMLPLYGRLINRLIDLKGIPGSPNTIQIARAALTNVEYHIVAVVYECIRGSKMPRDEKLVSILRLFRTGAKIDPVTLQAGIMHVFGEESVPFVQNAVVRMRSAKSEDDYRLIGRELDGLLAPIDTPLVGGEPPTPPAGGKPPAPLVDNKMGGLSPIERVEENTMAARKYPPLDPHPIEPPPAPMVEKHVLFEEHETGILREVARVFSSFIKKEQAEVILCQLAYTLVNLRPLPGTDRLSPEFAEVIGDKLNVKVCSIILQTLLFWDSSFSFISNIIPQSVGADKKEYIKRLFTGLNMFDEETRFGLADVFLRQLIKQRVDRPVSTDRAEMYKGYGMMQNVFLGSHDLRDILDVLERRKGMIKIKGGFEKLQRTALSELKYRSFVYWRELAVTVKLSLEPKEHKKWIEEVGRAYAKVFNAAMDLKLIPVPTSTESVKKAVASYPKLEETDIAMSVLSNGAGMSYREGIKVTVNGFFVLPVPPVGAENDEMRVCRALEARLMTTDLVIFDELLVSGKLFERFAGENYIDQ